jgi:hypothetical protein
MVKLYRRHVEKQRRAHRSIDLLTLSSYADPCAQVNVSDLPDFPDVKLWPEPIKAGFSKFLSNLQKNLKI